MIKHVYRHFLVIYDSYVWLIESTLNNSDRWCVFIISWRCIWLILNIVKVSWKIIYELASTSTSIFFSFVPESPRWLLAKNRKDETMVVLERMASFNKVSLPDDIDILDDTEMTSKTTVRIYLINWYFIWEFLFCREKQKYFQFVYLTTVMLLVICTEG